MDDLTLNLAVGLNALRKDGFLIFSSALLRGSCSCVYDTPTQDDNETSFDFLYFQSRPERSRLRRLFQQPASRHHFVLDCELAYGGFHP
jgi:hypothetical protein